MARSVVLALAMCGAGGCIQSAMRDAWDGMSIGGPSNGVVVRPVRLADRGDGYDALRSEDAGGQHFGTARLVRAIEHAASAVALQSRGAPLRVGDLSGPTGGAIPHHRSHRSGRDADLLFFTLDEAGHSIAAPGFVRYDANGHSIDPQYATRFDVHRNWLLVASLLADAESGIVWIFCADRLKTLLIDHARTLGVNDETLARAGEVLHQPGDAAPHDDHFHIRVACTPDERAHGCRDGGALGWWLEHRYGKGDAAPLDDDAVLALLEDLPPAAIVPARARRIHSGVASRMGTATSETTAHHDRADAR